MKRILTIALLVCAFALLLCVAAYAAEVPTTAGIYELKTEAPAGLTVTATPCTSTKAAVNKTTAKIDNTDQDFYAEAEQLKVTVSGAAANTQQLILAQDEEASPTKDNIRYIDQDAAEGGAVTFYVYPDKLEKGKTYYIFIVGTDGNKIKLASFKYYQSYKLGDVDNDGELTSFDASLILQYLVKTYTFVGNGELAADVDGDKEITSFDASLILQHLVKTYVIPGWEA